MTVLRCPLRWLGMVALGSAVLSASVLAQKVPVAGGADETRRLLIGNARSLESRGRPDMAMQVWQQILLSDPKNVDALEGMARDLKLTGSPNANAALQRLRTISPNDPNIAAIEGLSSTHAQDARLREAEELARHGRNDDAMRIYREVYGDHPPDGDAALAYYQTLYGTVSGKDAAIAGVRSLSQRNPNETRYAIELGTILTYDPRTRAEGIHILQAHSKDANAQVALRQALLWNAANPASAADLRQYVKEHPEDTEIAAQLKENEGKLARMNSGIARTPAERAAFAALNAKRLDEAEKRFDDLLTKQPDNGRMAAGMGFLRMQQGNFSGAIRFFTQAQTNGYRSLAVQNGLATSRFWFTMGEASQAFAQNQLDVAAAKYKEAIEMRPQSPEALNGLAGLLTREEQFSEAAGIYAQLVKIDPKNAEAWRGEFLSYARDGQNDQALQFADRFPPTVKADMEKDPEYLGTLAAIYRSQHRDADAERVLSQALALPFPDIGVNLKADTRLEYAGILMEARRFSQAAEMYGQILSQDNGNVAAWLGLVSARHELGQDRAAIGEVQKMPPAAYETAMTDAGFVSLLGSIYQQAGEYDVAQELLERATKLETASGGQPRLQTNLQLAAIYLQRGRAVEAYAIYRKMLMAHPERADAWKGLIETLQATNHPVQAVAELAQIPETVRKQLESDIDFVQAEASAYAATSDTARATEAMNRVRAHYARLGTPAPANIEIQNAWLLYNANDDRELYPVLMRLGGRQDLTVEQREALQNIWANWSVRRATAAFENNDNDRAVEILEAATQAFPANQSVRKVLAGGYLRTGHAKEALKIYKSLPMNEASTEDYQGAIGAALAANDKVQAETWLRQALEKFPKDAAVLGLAARFEQARGDKQRAADYWRASIAAMPPPSATDRLAQDLTPDAETKAHPAGTGDLERLLKPENEPSSKANKLPPLPAFGPDAYSGSAPVVLSRPQTGVANSTVPTTTQVPASPKRGATAAPGQYTGKVTLPPSEENIDTTDSEVPPSHAPGKAIDIPETLPPSLTTAPQRNSHPTLVNPAAAQPGQQDKTPNGLPPGPEPKRTPDQRAADLREQSGGQTDPKVNADPVGMANTPTHNAVFNPPQYTPSAQDAATRAYSAPKQAASIPTQQGSPAPGQNAKAAKTPAKTVSSSPEAAPKSVKPVQLNPPPPETAVETVPTLVTAPAEPGTSEPDSALAQQETPSAGSGSGVTDEQLEKQNLPPLTGKRTQRQGRAVNPREEAEMQLRSLESGYSGWAGGAGVVNFRSGTLGYDRLTELAAPFELSTPFGYHARFTLVAKPVFLDSGQADGSSVIAVEEASSAGFSRVNIPQPLGTDADTATTAPAQQNASGIGGEIQFAFANLGLAAGWTPYGFPVSHMTGRANWRPANGPVTLSFTRDSVKDSQLSYAGLHDPGTESLTYAGNIWGGVIANQGNLQFNHGDEQSGFYIAAGAQYLTGHQVQTNRRIDGTGGAYWRVKTVPEYGSLSVGGNFFGMHYAHDEQAYTYGMGGYFSPQAYFLANVPVTWTGHDQTRLHYEISGGFGVQAFQSDATPLFPLAAQAANESALKDAKLPAQTSVGANYNVRAALAYQINPHWFTGGFVSANNARNYQSVSAGFSIHYMFRSQPSTVAGPTGLFPTEGLRPFTVP